MAHPIHGMLGSRKLFLVLVLAGLALRVGVVAVNDGPVESTDANRAVVTSERLVSGEAFDPYEPPGLAMVLAAVHAVSNVDLDDPDIVTATMLALYMALSVLVFLLGSAVADRRAANMAVAVIALTPSLILLSVSAQPVLLAAVAITGGAYLAAVSLRWVSWINGFLAGAVFGLGVLVDPLVILAALIWPGYLLIKYHRPAAAAMSLLGVLLVVGAWSAKVHRQTSEWVFVNHSWGKTVFLGNNEWTPMYRTWYLSSERLDYPGFDDFEAVAAQYEAHELPEQMVMFRDHGLKHIAEHPGTWGIRSVNRFRGFLGFQTLAGATLLLNKDCPRIVGYAALAGDALLWLLVAVGAAAALLLPAVRARGGDAVRSLGRLALLFAIPYWLLLAHGNHHLPIIPILAIMAGTVLSRREPSAPQPAPTSKGRRLVFVAVALAFVAIQVEWFLMVRQG